MLTQVNNQDHPTADLEGEMSIYNAALLKEQLQAFLKEKGGLELNLSKVTELDGAGVQLLLATKKEALANRQTLSLTHPSAPVLDVLELLELLELVTYFEENPTEGKS